MAFTPAHRVLFLAFFTVLVAVAYSGEVADLTDTFTAKLIGANEVPKNDSEAARKAVGDKRGVVQMKLDFYKKEGNLMWVEYSVKASKLEGEMPPTKTHIHPGRKGENNPVLLELPCKYKKTGASEWLPNFQTSLLSTIFSHPSLTPAPPPPLPRLHPPSPPAHPPLHLPPHPPHHHHPSLDPASLPSPPSLHPIPYASCLHQSPLHAAAPYPHV
ncbi:unnamed protein product [Closterium sp. Naga37s-1]|nr:unnamed protein product [Closterium sp. Naga37s-1]